MNKKFLGMMRFVRYSVIVLILVAITAFMIYAQPNTNGNANGRADRGSDRTPETRTVERDDGFDWGWLGLLGLLGLAGLIPKSRKVEVQEFRDTNRPTTGTGTTH
ncbi:MAG TPA: WGxxGxxG family protein [Pyrinomonadaceae bacterium]|nr:WGxxGxxG family protein [Pyrinomonadaceae bacterium]